METLNSKKREFNYGHTKLGNMSLKVQTKLNIWKFKIPSRKIEIFVYYFPFLVGDLVPENNQIWLFMINFIEMISRYQKSRIKLF